MIYGDPNDTMLKDYPPGHPAGTDEFVSVGAARPAKRWVRAGCSAPGRERPKNPPTLWTPKPLRS